MDFVAPFVGAWIEISLRLILPLTVRVAPFVGAWIEMDSHILTFFAVTGRSLRGSVD